LLLLAAIAACLAFAGLGSCSAPRTYWAHVAEGEIAIADAGSIVHVDRISVWIGLGQGACSVELSQDGTSWQRAGLVEQPDAFGFMEWRVLTVSASSRYLRLTVERPGLEIGEVGAFGRDGRSIPLRVIEGPTEPFDEQSLVVRTPTARTGMYFDETYFARSAWEQLRGLESTETSHPPLGRTIISLGIALWGMNPFGWRFMGALAGALSVVAMYLAARRLLGKTSWAFLAGLLFALDFLRFAQSRMATVDVFVLLFTLLAFWLVLEHAKRDRPWPWLVAAGIALGAGMACKWSAAYSAMGIVVLVGAAELRKLRDARHVSFGAIAVTVARCFVCLAVVPAIVYALSWLPWMIGRGATLADVVARHASMYRYHATIAETRWYASPWWQWPLDIRPIWLYRGTIDVAADRVASIVTMGNSAIWWSGTLALPIVAALALARRDRAAGWTLVAFVASWLPWVFAARRLTFIYHFLPATPYLILGLVRCVQRLAERFPRTRGAGIALAAVAALGFTLYLPLLTGIPVSRAYAEAMQWLKTWIFFA